METHGNLDVKIAGCSSFLKDVSPKKVVFELASCPLKEVSQRSLIFEVSICIVEGSLAEKTIASSFQLAFLKEASLKKTTQLVSDSVLWFLSEFVFQLFS